MKKIFILSAVVLSITAISCTKELSGPENRICTTITATIADTKTALGEKEGTAWPNYWKAGDMISVNGVCSDALGAEQDGKVSAYFTFDGGLTTPYCATYPASAVSDYKEGNATITFPASQKYVKNSYDPASFVMTGNSSEESTLLLSPCVSIFHLNLNTSAAIKKVKLTGASGAALSGKFTTDFSTLTPKATSNVVDMTVGDVTYPVNDFFICVPAGLEGDIKVEIFDTLGGYMSKEATVKSALVAGQMYSPASLTYTPSYDIAITASGITSSTAVISWDNAPSVSYTIGVYSDAACGALVNSYNVPANDPCWAGESPRFCISGLKAGTTYYVKVTNTDQAAESNVLPVTTSEFQVVEVSSTPAAKGDVILAEDFSELCWDCDMIGSGAGWYPTETARTTSFTTLKVDSYQKAATSNEKKLSNQTDALLVSRLSHWAQGANPNLYIHPGYVKLVGSSKVTHIVTPALDNIPEGKKATLEVEVTASAYYSESSSSFCTQNAVVAVQTGEIGEIVGDNTNTLDLTANAAAITLKEETAWNTYKVTLKGVVKGNRLAFGAASGVTKNDARMNLSDIKVTVTSIIDDTPGERDITDFASFKSFCDDVNGGGIALNGHLKKDITLTAQEAAQISSIDAFYASFDGESHSINGMTCPLVNKLYGEISNLTLNSTIEDAGKDVGIFARAILAENDKQGTISDCEAKGTLNFNASVDDDATHIVGGIAGSIEGGIITSSSSSATVKAGSANPSGTLYIGGIVGYCDGILGEVVGNGEVETDGIALSGDLYQGGIAGKMKTSDDEASIENVTNNGKVTVGAASCKSGFWGGVFGDNAALSNVNITNNAALNIGAIVPSSYFFIGGISGNASSFGAVYSNVSCSSSASITIDEATISTSTGFALGGLFGKMTNFETIQGSSNSAPIVINNMKQTTKGRFDVGGIVGYIQTGSSNTHADGVVSFSNVYNAGSISFTGTEANKLATYIRLGGLIGNALSERKEGDETLSLEGCYNSGKITMPMASASAGIMIGGLVGNDRFAHYVQTGSYNTGDIELSGCNMGTKDDGLYGLHIGGNVGFIYHEGTASTATITGDKQHATNSGNVTYTVTTTYCAYRPAVGGIVGVAAGKGSERPLTLNLIDCTNSGELKMAMTSMPSKANMGYVYSYSYAGGILGVAGIPFSNTSTKEDDTTVYDQSYVVSNITDCSNSATIKWGKINSSMSSSYNYYWSTYAGGIIGVSRPVPGTEYMTTITSCTNSGDVLSYDGCAGGIAGAMLYTGTITGSADAYTVNTGKVMKDGCSKPQGQAGGVIGWVRIDGDNPDGLNFNYCCNKGYAYANAGVGGFWGYVSGFSKYTGSIHHLKLAGTVRSSTTTGNSGMFSGNASGDIKGNSSRISNVAVGGTLNGKNSTETTISFNATDFVSQVRAGFMEYKTTANNLTEEQVSSMKLQYWDGETEPEWL